MVINLMGSGLAALTFILKSLPMEPSKQCCKVTTLVLSPVSAPMQVCCKRLLSRTLIRSAPVYERLVIDDYFAIAPSPVSTLENPEVCSEARRCFDTAKKVYQLGQIRRESLMSMLLRL